MNKGKLRLAAVETGGTKMVCAVGDELGNIFEKISIPTSTPQETVANIIEYFHTTKAGIDLKETYDGVGVASFGPLDLDVDSKTYGYITTTPKPGWLNFDILGSIKNGLHCPAGFDTDVNGSVLGEYTFGQAQGKKCALYLTVGTGIGAGICIEGRLLHGMLHPEAGHIMINKHQADHYLGKCPYHKNCFEGLASGPAIQERYGIKAEQLIDRKEVWELEADYIAQALCNYVMILSPDIIILGGGVMKNKQLFPLVRNKLKEYLGGYIKTKELEDMEHYVVEASLGEDQGVLGALELARRACSK